MGRLACVGGMITFRLSGVATRTEPAWLQSLLIRLRLDSCWSVAGLRSMGNAGVSISMAGMEGSAKTVVYLFVS